MDSMNLKKKIKREFQQENQTNLQFETIASQNGFIKNKVVFHRNGYKIATCMLSLLLLICLGFMIIQDAKEKNKVNEIIESINPPLVDRKETNESESNNDKQTITNEEIEQKAEIVDQIIKSEYTDTSTTGNPLFGSSDFGGLNIQDIITGVFITNVSFIKNKGEISIGNKNDEIDSDDSTLNQEKIYFYISKIKNNSGEEENLMIKANIHHDYQMMISYLDVNQKVALVNGKMQMIDKIYFYGYDEVEVQVSLYLEEHLVDTYNIVIKR